MENMDPFKTVKMDKNAFNAFREPSKEVEKSKVALARKKGSFLLVTSGPGEGEVYYIDRSTMVIGREKDVDIVIAEPFISRKHAQIVSSRHAELVTTESEVQIVDLGSTNGTYVNKQKVEKAILNDGDEIEIGNVRMKFFQEELSSSTEEISEGVSDFYRQVFSLCEEYFGANTKKFLDRQISAHLFKKPQDLSVTDKQVLARWVKISASLFIQKEKAEELAQRILSL